jgi:hypothetical protein
MLSMKRTPNPSTYGFAFGEGSVGGRYGSNAKNSGHVAVKSDQRE